MDTDYGPGSGSPSPSPSGAPPSPAASAPPLPGATSPAPTAGPGWCAQCGDETTHLPATITDPPTLPVTGPPVGGAAELGLALVLLGIAAMAAARHRARTSTGRTTPR